MKVFAALAVVVAVVAGIYVTGALITNDFTLAMVLTAAWMGLAFVICVAIGFRRRDFAVPVVGAFVVTAAVAGVLLGRSMFFDTEVNERVATAAAPAPSSSGGAPRDEARPRNELLGRGRFSPVAHAVRGEASAIRLGRGGNVVTLTGFEVDNGPDLRVYLVAGPARNESEVSDFEDLGALKGNKGDQQYEVPDGVRIDRYDTVVIWCRAFSVNFARAPLS